LRPKKELLDARVFKYRILQFLEPDLLAMKIKVLFTCRNFLTKKFLELRKISLIQIHRCLSDRALEILTKISRDRAHLHTIGKSIYLPKSLKLLN
jgi:hypothetical protein